MKLKINWNIISNDENSRSQDLNENINQLTFNQLPIHENEYSEQPIYISKVTLGQENQSKTRYNISSPIDMIKTLKKTMIDSIENCSNTQYKNTSSDHINRLTESFQSWNLNDNTCSKNYFWSNHKTNINSKDSLNSPLSNMLSKSNPFLKCNIQSSSNRNLFNQNCQPLWSIFHSTSTTIDKDLSTEKCDSVSPDIFYTPSKKWPDQSSILSISPSQVVPCSAKETSASVEQEFSQMKSFNIMNDNFFDKKEDTFVIENSKSNIFFVLFLFIIGLVLGYYLKNTFLSSLIFDWVFFIWEKYIPLCQEYVYLLCIYLQTIIRYFWLLIFSQNAI